MQIIGNFVDHIETAIFSDPTTRLFYFIPRGTGKDTSAVLFSFFHKTSWKRSNKGFNM